jgi:hypothetical protein
MQLSLNLINYRLMLDDPSSAPVYQYMYTHRGTFTTVDPFLLSENLYMVKLAISYLTGHNIWDRDLGVAHADQLLVLFRPHFLPVASLFTKEEELVSKRLIEMFINFAR